MLKLSSLVTDPPTPTLTPEPCSHPTRSRDGTQDSSHLRQALTSEPQLQSYRDFFFSFLTREFFTNIGFYLFKLIKQEMKYRNLNAELEIMVSELFES